MTRFASLLGLVLTLVIQAHLTLVASESPTHNHVKTSSFIDPNINYLYRISSFNRSSIATDSTHRGLIKVARVKVDAQKRPIGELENIQTIKFHPSIIDYDTLCSPNYCYLVVVTSRSKENIELYGWQRTQFDLLTRRDSFARPHAVKLFRIFQSFYIVVAQDQLHLSQNRLLDDEEPNRFVGCPILKFMHKRESDMKYHQFIRLSFNPRYVEHFTSFNEINGTTSNYANAHENHYIIFTPVSNVLPTPIEQATSFMWSPLNDYFWPFRISRGAQLERRPGHRHQFLRLPSELTRLNVNQTTTVSNPPVDPYEPVETCFNHLQKLLNDREINARKLIESSRSLWRSSDNPYTSMTPNSPGAFTDISARVVVHGNVVVKGSMIDNPKITILGHQRQIAPPEQQISFHSHLDTHSPALVDNKIKQALYKLKFIKEKLSRAISRDPQPGSITNFNSPIKFFGNIQADQVVFRSRGISNPNVRINGIQFVQLQHELVNLIGDQHVAAKVIFAEDVTADRLEIHAQVNKAYFMKDALDATSMHIQVIEPGFAPKPGSPALEFSSINTRDLALSHNATFNSIRLDDFITRDVRPQVVVGLKSFKNLRMRRLILDHPGIMLNGYDIAKLAQTGLRLQTEVTQTLTGDNVFTRPVKVDRLILNNLLNGHINMSQLIIDSVKTRDDGVQQISGFKNFLQDTKIAQLNTDGAINGVQINQIFNLNPAPPTSDHARYLNSSIPLPVPVVTGNFTFGSMVSIMGNLNPVTLNGINIAQEAVRRFPKTNQALNIQAPPQVVSGTKIFARPLRITNAIHLADSSLVMQNLNISRPISYPLVNGIDIRQINQAIRGQMNNPPLMFIENLEIEGNLNLKPINMRQSLNRSASGAASFGRSPECPLDVFKNKLVLHGPEDQSVTVPIYVDSLRAKSILLDPGFLNSIKFPDDFVLRSAPNSGSTGAMEPVYGHKTFDHVVVGPSGPIKNPYAAQGGTLSTVPQQQSVIFGSRSSINTIGQAQLQTFINTERSRNSSGETIIQSLRIYGNLKATRINGYSWPHDILLKSTSSTMDQTQNFHKRIYSPLIFTDGGHLEVQNQLVLRGPIQLKGKLNGVNLTEFARQSVTYGDKDLLSMARPLRNKVFAGGLTVVGEFRSQGLIDGVHLEEMRSRVVTINPRSEIRVRAPKVFLSDVNFIAPVSMAFFKDVPMIHNLGRIKFQYDPSGSRRLIQVFSKKTITGALRINKNLFVEGTINGINFADLEARAIPLSQNQAQLKFNKTLTIEGDAFMDNLLIDEKNGIIDGVRLINLLPLEPTGKNELVITGPQIFRQNGTGNNNYQLAIDGQVHDCQISCSLNPHAPLGQAPVGSPPPPPAPPQTLRPSEVFDLSPIAAPQQQQVVMSSRPIEYMGKNVSMMRTIPPYTVQAPIYTSPRPVRLYKRSLAPVDPRLVLQNLAVRRPVAIRYELEQRNFGEGNVIAHADFLRAQMRKLQSQIISLNLLNSTRTRDLVIGFIESQLRETSHLILPEQSVPHSDHFPNVNSFLQLDQTDFYFFQNTYHLSVGVETGTSQANSTKVLFALQGKNLKQLSVLPVENPNNAMFLELPHRQGLYLLISQDLTWPRSGPHAQCGSQASKLVEEYYRSQAEIASTVGGVHVYHFYVWQNSTHPDSAYFDLHQTIDLPGIDSFNTFTYQGSTYVVAVSRMVGRIYLLILRGYAGFQIVSHADVPSVDYTRVMFAPDGQPMLIIYLTSGSYKFMEPVII